jgi:hypothetical protein
MSRLVAVVGGLAWLGVLALVALAVRWPEPARPQPAPTPQRSTRPPLLDRLNAARPDGDGTSWLVTRAVSAHSVLLANVRADDPADARGIAERLVKAVEDREYDEVLVYVWASRGASQFAARRVQWTPGGGYAELVIGD